MNEVINEELIEIGKSAKRASKVLITLTKPRKNEALLKIAEALIAHSADIIYSNDKDIEKAKAKGTSEAMIDRLRLNEARIEQMAEGLRQVAALDDPVGEVLSMKERPNGLMIGQKRVPRCSCHYLRITSQCNSGCIRSLLQDIKCCDPEGGKRCS